MATKKCVYASKTCGVISVHMGSHAKMFVVITIHARLIVTSVYIFKIYGHMFSLHILGIKKEGWHWAQIVAAQCIPQGSFVRLA